MTRQERTLFAFQDKCFPLETIETMYDDGMLSPGDIIQIIEPRTTPYKVPLKMLITIYGAEHPFRMIRRSPDVESDSESKSESPEPPEPPEPPNQPKTAAVPGDEDHIFQDYPLLHADEQPEDELITGQEVIDEMERFKAMIPVNALPKELLEYFFFVEGKLSTTGKRTRLIMCRFCGPFGIAAVSFFKHLFSDDHIKKLSLRKVSRTSFNFWYDHLKHYRRIAMYRSQHRDGYIPLFSSDSWDASKAMLTEMEVRNLVDSFEQISESDFVNFRCYASQIFKVRHLKKYCYTCKCPMPAMSYQYAQHVFSEEHLSALRNVPDTGFQFWIEAFRIPRFEFVKEDETIIKTPLFDEIPLLRNIRDSPKRKLSDSEIQTLTNLSAKWGCTSDNFYLITFYDQLSLPQNCQVCSVELTNYQSPGRVALPLTKHILSEEHLKKLNGVSQAHVNFWVNLLYLSTSVKGVGREKKMRILTDRNDLPIPLLDFTLESEFMEPSLRLPKIDELYEVYKRVDEETLKSSKITLGKTGKELIAKELKCYACDLPAGYFENNSELLAHMFTRIHVTYLVRFGFSNQAFLWWKKTLQDLVAPEKMIELLEMSEVSKPSTSTRNAIDDEKVVINNNGIMPNICHIPLMDAPPEGVEMFESSRNPLLELSKELENRCTGEQQQRGRTMYTDQYHCTFCDENLEPIELQNELFIFHHVASRTHWEKMNCKAPSSEIKFWENWAESIASDRILENHPRVPMLDRCGPNDVLVSKEKLDKFFKTKCLMCATGFYDTPIAEEEDVFWKCSYCSDLKHTENLHDKLDALKHIVTPGHQKKMGDKISAADLEYWESWATEIQRKNEEYDKKELEKCKRSYGDTMDKPKNSPRVPLLDGFNVREDLYSTDDYKSKYHRMREELSLLQPGELTDKPLTCTCYHCPGEPKMSNYREVMEHIFDGIHCQNIKFLAVEEDFDFFLKPFLAVIKNRLAPHSPPEPRPIPKRPMVSYKLEFCQLPLFDYNYFKEELGEECPGPTNRQIDFIERMTIKEGGEPGRMFEIPTKCQYCQIDMSDFSTQEVAKHAFSMKHLKRFEYVADEFHIEEFEWWMEKLKSEGFVIPSEEPFLANDVYLGGLKPIFSTVRTPVFQEVSEEEQGLISNLDERKVREHGEVLLRLFGGCVYCKLWITQPMETIAHFLSEQHFEKVKEFHPVKQFDVDDIMRFVKMCQLS